MFLTWLNSAIFISCTTTAWEINFKIAITRAIPAVSKVICINININVICCFFQQIINTRKIDFTGKLLSRTVNVNIFTLSPFMIAYIHAIQVTIILSNACNSNTIVINFNVASVYFRSRNKRSGCCSCWRSNCFKCSITFDIRSSYDKLSIRNILFVAVWIVLEC